MKNVREKLEVRKDSAMPCKSRKTSGSTSSKLPKHPRERSCDDHRQGEILSTGNTKQRKTICACIVGAQESTRKRVTETQNRDHEDHIDEREPILCVNRRLRASIFLCLNNENSGRTCHSRQRVGKSEELARIAGAESQKQKRGHRAGTKWMRIRSFYVAQGLMPLEETGTRTKVPEIQRSSRTKRRRCEGRLRRVRCFHRARIFSVSNDGGPSSGRDVQTTRTTGMRRT